MTNTKVMDMKEHTRRIFHLQNVQWCHYAMYALFFVQCLCYPPDEDYLRRWGFVRCNKFKEAVFLSADADNHQTLDGDNDKQLISDEDENSY